MMPAPGETRSWTRTLASTPIRWVTSASRELWRGFRDVGGPRVLSTTWRRWWRRSEPGSTSASPTWRCSIRQFPVVRIAASWHWGMERTAGRTSADAAMPTLPPFATRSLRPRTVSTTRRRPMFDRPSTVATRDWRATARPWIWTRCRRSRLLWSSAPASGVLTAWRRRRSRATTSSWPAPWRTPRRRPVGRLRRSSRRPEIWPARRRSRRRSTRRASSAGAVGVARARPGRVRRCWRRCRAPRRGCRTLARCGVRATRGACGTDCAAPMPVPSRQSPAACRPSVRRRWTSAAVAAASRVLAEPTSRPVRRWRTTTSGHFRRRVPPLRTLTTRVCCWTSIWTAWCRHRTTLHLRL